jgi:hypothetical protein
VLAPSQPGFYRKVVKKKKGGIISIVTIITIAAFQVNIFTTFTDCMHQAFNKVYFAGLIHTGAIMLNTKSA